MNQQPYPEQKSAPCQPRIVFPNHQNPETYHSYAPYYQEEADVRMVEMQRFTLRFLPIP